MVDVELRYRSVSHPFSISADADRESERQRTQASPAIAVAAKLAEHLRHLPGCGLTRP